MKYVAVYINCLYGKFIVHGPFDTEASAWSWVHKQDHDPDAYSVLPINHV